MLFSLVQVSFLQKRKVLLWIQSFFFANLSAERWRTKVALQPLCSKEKRLCLSANSKILFNLKCKLIVFHPIYKLPIHLIPPVIFLQINQVLPLLN